MTFSAPPQGAVAEPENSFCSETYLTEGIHVLGCICGGIFEAAAAGALLALGYIVSVLVRWLGY